MKYEKEDRLFLIYRDQELSVSEIIEYKRSGTKSIGLEVITLENGIRILPVHFRYNKANINMNMFDWVFRKSYPKSLMKELIQKIDKNKKDKSKNNNWKSSGASFPLFVKG